MSSQPSSITSTSYHRRKSVSASITSHQLQRLTPTRSYPTPCTSSAKDYRQRSREFTADFERHARTPFLVDRVKCCYGRDLNSHETRQFGHTTRNSPSPRERTIETSNFKFYPSIKCLESNGGHPYKNRKSLYFNRYMHSFLLVSVGFFVYIIQKCDYLNIIYKTFIVSSTDFHNPQAMLNINMELFLTRLSLNQKLHRKTHITMLKKKLFRMRQH